MENPSQVLERILPGAAGLLGGITLSIFWKPERLRQLSVLSAGAVVGGVAVTSATMLTGLIAAKVGMDVENPDVAIGIGYIVGLVSIGVITFISNYFKHREQADLLDAIKELRMADQEDKQKKLF